MLEKSKYARFFILANCLVCLASFVLAREIKQTGDDEKEFIFSGKCPNGVAYRLYSYDKLVDGVLLPFYDYEGPVGKGTVKTAIQPRVMAARICRELAEISDDPNL